MNKFAIVSLLAAGSVLSNVLPAVAQQKKKAAPAAKTAAKPAAKVKSKPAAPGFTKFQGMEYKIVKDVPGTNAKMGDIIEFHLIAMCDTYTLSNTRVQQNGKPAATPVQEAKTPGEFSALFPKLSAGDSVLINVSCDTLLSTIPADRQQGLPPWLKKGNMIVVNLSIVSVKSKEQYEAEQKIEMEKTLKEEDKNMQEYFAKNNLKPTKTASGLYYTITKEGTGDQIKSGQTVSMHYTGKLLNGSTFDSNQEPAKPFEFPVGQGRVIKGWDEGVVLLKKGTKASFYIPSGMAYGPQSPTPAIPPNSPLVFDVEVLDVK